MTQSLMLVGTSSNVGKSVLTTALCRIFYQDGYRVAPFKAQNMSLNSAVTPSGREIGRAQAAQAEACGLCPNEHMNPVLLKPTGHMASQVIVQGRVLGQRSARDYFRDEKEALWNAVTESYYYLAERFEIVVLEGAGSPVEMNLKSRDIANMRCADMADASVLLVADIDRGGVFASVVGTMQLLMPQERTRIKGILINKFRGNPSLFQEGRAWIESYVGVPVLGVIPYISEIGIDEEDSVGLQAERYKKAIQVDGCGERLRIAMVPLPHISNFTDFDPLFIDPDVDAFYAESPKDLDGVDALIIPGTKATVLDLNWLFEKDWASAICKARFRGSRVLGICGGFQMLGGKVLDPYGVESEIPLALGMGLVPMITTMLPEKTTRQVHAELCGHFSGKRVRGYEIHMGETVQTAPVQAFAKVRAIHGEVYREDGCISEDGKVLGTYLHGVLHDDGFRTEWLNQLRADKGWMPIQHVVATDVVRMAAYDRLAHIVRSNLDMETIYDFLRPVKWKDDGDGC